MRRKVSIIGAGNVGASAAAYLANANICDVMLVDIIPDMPAGKALDLYQAGPVVGYDVAVHGSNDFADMKGSEMVVVTSGLARKPGMSREDLLKANAEIIKSVTENIVKYAPNAFILMVANPLDLMTYHAAAISKFPKNKVFGQAGVLDSARFRAFVAMELNISMSDVQAMVLGGHGDTMVPLVKFTTVGGIPIEELIPKDKINAIVERTRNGGGEIVKLLKTGSAFYAPAIATVQMVEAVILDRKRVLPVSAFATGQYGINSLYIGLPVVLGAGGVEKILEINLGDEGLAALRKSAGTYKEHLKELGYIV